MEEFGRRLAPEPLLDAVLLPGGLIAEAGTAEQRQRVLPEVAAGEKLLAFAHAEPGSRWPAAELTTVAVAGGDGYRITGVKNPVPHGDCADLLVVSAALPDGGAGLFLVAADAAARTPYRTFDGLRGAQLEFDGAAAELLGEPGDASGAIADRITAAQASLCAESVGAMAEALRLTTEYLKTRKQFGVTLSKFQTLTQRAASMYVSLELARSMSLYATASLADGEPDPVAASRARLQASRSGRGSGPPAAGAGIRAARAGRWWSRCRTGRPWSTAAGRTPGPHSSGHRSASASTGRRGSRGTGHSPGSTDSVRWSACAGAAC